MRGITTPLLKVVGMFQVTQEKPHLTGENPEAEDDPRLWKEPPWWESKGSHVLITGGPQIRIPIKHTPLKWNHTTIKGGPLSLGQTSPLMFTISHHLAVLHKDPQVTGAHLSMATPQVTGHPPQNIFVTIQLKGGQVRRNLTRGLSVAPKGSQVFRIRSRGVETIVGISIPEEGPMNIQVMAWSAGMRMELSLIRTMENTDPLGHRGAPERCMGEAHVQRGTKVKLQSHLGRICKEEAWRWPGLPSHRGPSDYLYSAPPIVLTG